jgi:two-component system phosphate regulon sensor histidine kinase PhoR
MIKTAPSPMIGNSSFELLQKIVDAARECVLVVGPEQRIRTANQTAEETLSRNGEALAGKRLSEAVRDLELHEAFRRALEERLESDLRLEFIAFGRRKFDVHVAPLELDGVGYAIGYFHETTKIERLERVRQEFLSNISHELRTPLTSIIAFVETLEDGGIDDRENNRRFLSVIRRNAERMHDLISDILELSLIESGNVSVEIRDVQLRSLVDEVFTSLSSRSAGRGITLVNEVESGSLVAADAVRLEQMLTNLVDNAIKFNRAEGSVTVGLQRLNGSDVVTVADNGEGILPEHLERIFERFYRADRSRTRDVGGTGLGLAIVKHLAKLHGGEVSVNSELTRGSTFRIHLPAK